MGRSPPFGLGLAILAIWLQCLGVFAATVTVATDGPGNFQGYFINPEGTTRTISCGTDSVFAQSSTYGGCCRIGGNCNFPTACGDAVLSNRLGGTAKCSTKSTCYTMTVYGDFPSATDSWVVHNCAHVWTASTLWRGMPTATTTGSTSSDASETDASSAGPGNTASDSAGEVSATASAGAANGNDTVEPTESSSSSKAWIAGVVVGAVAVAAGLGVLGFWLGRRRRANAGGVDDGTGEAKGFKLHSASHVRSGGSPGVGGGGDDYLCLPPSYDDESFRKLRANAPVIADGVELAATGRHAELEAAPVPGRLLR